MSPDTTDAYDGGFQQPPGEQAYLRASDADRRAAIEIINRGHAEGRLTEPERQDRVARAQVAHSQPELNVLTRDLVVIQDSHRADEIEPRAGGALAPTAYGSNSIVAALSTKERGGSWVVPPRLSVSSILGTVKLDMREASFESLDVALEISCFLGDVKVWLPEGVEVVNDTRTIMGDVKLKKLSPARPGRPRITLTGMLLMGDVTVYGSEHISLADRIKGNF